MLKITVRTKIALDTVAKNPFNNKLIIISLLKKIYNKKIDSIYISLLVTFVEMFGSYLHVCVLVYWKVLNLFWIAWILSLSYLRFLLNFAW